MLTDEALYARVQCGDRSALAALVERYHATLLKFLYRMTDDGRLAEDLVQEAFVRMLTFHGKLPARFKPWVFTIAANLARDAFRSAAYRREIQDPFDDQEDRPEMVDGSGSAEDFSLRTSHRESVADALQRLPASQREVIVLRFYHELSLEEIAQVTGVPAGTVKSRLYKGLRQVKSDLEREESGAYERSN